MSTIRNVLHILSYTSSSIEAIAKLLLLNNESGFNAFSNFVNLMTKEDLDQRKTAWLKTVSEIGISDKDIPKEWIANTENVWQSESYINNVLDHQFDLDNHQLFTFIVSLTQLQFILGSRFKNFSGTSNMYEMDSKQTTSFAIRKLIQELGFSKERKYSEEDGKIESIFLHAATEIALAARINIISEIAKQSGQLKVYYTTNPRGLSKTESSTSEILATWLTEDQLLQPKIANHLKEIFSQKDLNLDWFNGLNKLRNIILESVNENFGLQLEEFPSAPNNEIYPTIYDQTAILDGNRDPLNNKWPHVGHLLNHFANKIGLSMEKVQFEVIPVSGSVINEKYKPAQTKELIDALFMQEKEEIIKTNTIYAVSDNSVSYGGIRQDIMLKILAKNIKDFTVNVVTYYDAIDSENVDFERITKEVAAQLYSYYELDAHIKETLLEQYEKEEIYSFRYN